MRPQLLTIEGLRSYREPVTVDFDQLAAGGLFGIVGPTGAGKSTIIDAIFLALYGDVPRNNSAIEFINPDATAATVELVFSMSRGGEWSAYRIRREWRRVKKRGSSELSAEISTPRVALWKQTGTGEELLADGGREVNQLIEESVIGIPMNDFRRSIVLPQGEFDRLLRAMPKERAQLLGRVFGLGRFGEPLQRRTVEWREGLDEQMQGLRAKLDVRGNLLLQADQVRADLTGASVALETTREALSTAEAAAQRLSQGQSLATAWERAKQELASTEKAAVDAERWRLTLDQADRAAQMAPKIEAFESAARRHADLYQRLMLKQQELATLTAQEQKLQTARDEAAAYLQQNEASWQKQIEQARRAVTVLAEVSDMETKAAQSRTAWERTQTALAQLDDKRSKLEQKRTAAQREVAALEESLAQQRVRPEEREQVSAQLAHAEASAAAESARASLRELEAALQKVREKLAVAESHPDLSRDVAGIEKLAREKQTAFEAARTLHLQLSEAEIAETAIGMKEAEVSRRTEELKASISHLKSQLAGAMEDVANALDAQNAAEQAWEAALRLSQAAHLALSLVENEPCPVCGSEEHPSPARINADVQAAKKAADAVAKILKIAQGEASHFEQSLARAQVQLEQTEELLAERRAERFAAMSRIERLRAQGEKLPGVPWLEAEAKREVAIEALATEGETLANRAVQDRKAYEAAVKAVREIVSARDIAETRYQSAAQQAKVAEAEEQRTRVESKLSLEEAKRQQAALVARDRQCAQWEAALQQHRSRLTPLEAELQQLDASQANARQQFERLRAQAELEATQAADRRRELEALAEGRDPNGWLKTLEAKYAQARTTATKTQDEWSTLHRLAESARTVAAELSMQSEHASAERTQAEAALAAALQETGFETIEAARTARLPAIERERLSAKVQHVLAQHAAARATSERLAREVEAYGGPLPSVEEVAAAIATQKHARQQYEQTFAEHSRLAEQLRQIELAEAESSELQQQVKSLSPKLARAELLEKLLRGEALVAHAADKHLSRILASATANLRHLSTDRYELLRGEDGAFAVKDRHQTGALRPASTLSGGESFLVSLALALALSDHIQQQGHVRFDFFFLDEGFGSLDDETLHIAVDALERLRGTQRTIGTISHLPALLDRLPRKLVVQKAPVGGTATVRVEG